MRIFFRSAMAQSDRSNCPSPKAECVGFIDSEIRGMSWSPDYELMVLVTGNRSILSMTQEWDIITEVPLQGDQLQVSQAISLL